jgi:DNA-binding FadR family transcriptional regulator
MLTQPLSDVSMIEETLANGTEPEANERKALYLLADHHGEQLSSQSLAKLYGLGSHTAAREAMPRLRRRGLVQERAGRWQIVDPLLADWLRRHSPFALRDGDG